MRKIILASASPRRRELLANAGVIFQVCPGNSEEKITKEIPEDIVKVSVYLHEGVAAYADRFVPRWEQANCAVAGPYWIDTTLANKGIGVQSICKILGFDLADVMAFGDNYNDLEMLAEVKNGVAMENSPEAVKKLCPYRTALVEDTLREILEGKYD